MDGRHVTSDGERLGLSNHTWSHLDAPFHLLPQGLTFERLDPAALPRARRARRRSHRHRTRAPRDRRRRELPHADRCRGSSSGSRRIRGGAVRDRVCRPLCRQIPHAARRRRALPARDPRGRRAAGDAASTPGGGHRRAEFRQAGDQRHRAPAVAGSGRCRRSCCSRRSTFECLRAHVQPLPPRVLLTVEPLRAFGHDADGALSSVYAYAPTPGEEAEFAAFSKALRSASLISA